MIEKKARGWKRAIETQIDLIAEQAARWQRTRVVICTYDPNLRKELETAIRARIGNMVELILSGISADLLVHTGPTLVGMAIEGL